MLVRRVARAMFAGWFAVEGLEAARRPQVHVARATQTWQELARRVELPAVPSATRLTPLVRLHGAAMVAAAAALALGRAPRTAALLLAGLAAPLLVVHRPHLHEPTDDAPHVPTPSRAERLLGADRFWRATSMVGGAVLVAIDLEGRPGVTWRVQHARAARAAARGARASLRETPAA